MNRAAQVAEVASTARRTRLYEEVKTLVSQLATLEQVSRSISPNQDTGSGSRYRRLMESLAATIDAIDPCTQGHSRRVTANALAVGAMTGLDEEQLRALEVAACLHDIGKVGVPDDILLKNGPLTAEERQAIQQHPAIGAAILAPVGFDPAVVIGVLAHHERVDGLGYPNGTMGEAIPLAARILCVADSFDAMVSVRSYWVGLSVQAAVQELEDKSGSQFDPVVVADFKATLRAGKIVLPHCRQAAPSLRGFTA